MTTEMTFKAFYSESELWSESAYAHVRQILMGIAPKIQTVGFITAENPNGQRLSKEENRQRNYSLWGDLRANNYGPIQIQGVYNSNMEHPFLVQNITKEELVQLSDRYAQESVIFGKRFLSRNNNPFFQFELIEHGQTVSTRFVTVSGLPIADRSTYSAVKGRKFVVPFFDDEFANYVPGQKLGTITYAQEELPAKESVQEIVQEIWRCENELEKLNCTEKHRWMYRGILRDKVEQLNELKSR